MIGTMPYWYQKAVAAHETYVVVPVSPVYKVVKPPKRRKQDSPHASKTDRESNIIYTRNGQIMPINEPIGIQIDTRQSPESDLVPRAKGEPGENFSIVA